MEPGIASGEHGMESASLMFSSTEEVSERRDNNGGARPVDMVLTLGEPQNSSQPLSTVWADFCHKKTQLSNAMTTHFEGSVKENH